MHKHYSVSLGTKVSKTFHCSSMHSITHSSRSQYVTYWGMQTMLIKDIFHPASYTVMTVDHSMSGVTAWMFVDIDCNRNHVILRLRTCYTISRLGVQSRDWNAISKFWECPTQSQDCTNSQIAQNINIHTYIHTCVQTRTDCAARLWASH